MLTVQAVPKPDTTVTGPGCAYCPHPADLQLGDEDGLQHMCLHCLAAFLSGVVRHSVRSTWLITTGACGKEWTR